MDQTLLGKVVRGLVSQWASAPVYICAKMGT